MVSDRNTLLNLEPVFETLNLCCLLFHLCYLILSAVNKQKQNQHLLRFTYYISLSTNTMRPIWHENGVYKNRGWVFTYNL